MIRRSVAGAVLGASLLAASLAWWGFLSLRTVLEPDRSQEIAEELLDNDEVRGRLIDNISDALTAGIPESVPVEGETVDAVSERVLNDPAIEALLISAFTDTHRAFLGDGDAPDNIDLSQVAATARATLVERAPQLDAVLPVAPVLNVPLPTEHIPDASPLRTFLQRVVPVLAIGAVLGAGFALFATTDRPGILRRAGLWAITTTAVYLVLGLGVPWLLRRYAPDGWEVLAAFLVAVLRATLLPSIVLGVVGAALLVSSAVWAGGSMARRERVRSAGSARNRSEAPQPVRPVPVSSGRSRPAVDPAPPPARYTARREAHRPAPRPAQPMPTQRTPQHPTPRVQESPYPDGSARGGSPYPDGSGGASRSPYPDGAGGASRSPYPDGAGGGTWAPHPGGVPQDDHSVFADIPPPGPAQPVGASGRSGGAGAPGGHSVFSGLRGTPDSPQDPYAPRWVEGHGWVLHPDDPRPPPRNVVWVEGVGHVVPGPPPSR